MNKKLSNSVTNPKSGRGRTKLLFISLCRIGSGALPLLSICIAKKCLVENFQEAIRTLKSNIRSEEGKSSALSKFRGDEKWYSNTDYD